MSTSLQPRVRDAIRDLTSRGLECFPLKEGTKLPAVSGWPDKSTSDASAALALSDVVAPAGNIGVHMRGHIGVDVDPKNNGGATFALLDDLRGFPPTLVARTPSGGEHWYYALPPGVEVGNTAGKLGPGIDTRGSRGYLAAPGSVTDRGAYTWLHDRPIAPAPQWLIDAVGAPSATAASRNATDVPDAPQYLVDRALAHLRTEPPAVADGTGNRATYEVAVRVREFGLSPAQTVEAMMAEWNDRCDPPWETGELAEVVGNAFRYAQNEIGAKVALPSRDLPDPISDESAKAMAALATQAPPAVTPQQLVAKKPPYAFSLAAGTLPDLSVLTGTFPPRDWVWSDIMLAGQARVLSAFGGAMKTTLSVQLGVHTALGLPFAGREVKAGIAVVVLGEEDADERNRRVSAVVREMRLTPDQVRTVCQRLMIFPLQGQDAKLVKRVGLHSVETTGLGDSLIEFAKGRSEALGLPVRFIGLDHYMMLTDGDPSDATSASALTTEAARIALETRAATLVVCHMPKGAAGKEEHDQHSVFGSAFIVNNTRGALILAKMTAKEAKVYGIETDQRGRYVQLTVQKANSGPDGFRVSWFERVYLPECESVALRAVALTPKPDEAKQEVGINIRQALITKVKEAPGAYTKNSLSRAVKPRDQSAAAIDGMLVHGIFVLRPPAAAERERYGHNPRTVHVVLAPGPNIDGPGEDQIARAGAAANFPDSAGSGETGAAEQPASDAGRRALPISSLQTRALEALEALSESAGPVSLSKWQESCRGFLPARRESWTDLRYKLRSAGLIEELGDGMVRRAARSTAAGEAA